MATKTVRIYTCQKHPKWSIETSLPIIDAKLSVVCPLCRDEWIVANIGLAECRTERREIADQK